jgi:hypothetical protein
VISPLSAHITLRGIKAQVTRELSVRCAPRFRIAVFGDSWIVSAATGKQTVCASIEDAALTVVDGAHPVGWPPGFHPRTASDCSAPQFPALDALALTEMVDWLLWFAANHPTALRGHPLPS